MKKYILHEKKRVSKVIGLLIFLSALQVSTNLINAFALQSLIELKMTGFLKWYGLFLFIWLIYLILLRIEKVQEQVVIQIMSTEIRHDLSNKIINFNYKEYHSSPTNIYASEYTNDLAQIEQSGFSNFFALINSVSSILFSEIALMFVHFSLFFSTIFLAALLITIPKLFSKQLQDANLAVTKENSRFLGKITDLLDGFDVLFSSGLSHLLVNKINFQSQKLATFKIDVVKKQTNIEIFIAFFNIMAQFGIILQTGILAGLGLISIGYLGATGGLASAMFNGLGQLGNNLIQIKSIASIFEKLNLGNEETSATTKNDLKPFTKGISLKNVNFESQGHQILKNFSATFLAGEKYALLGPSGSGKSTILNIINGRIEAISGEILFDNIEYADLNLESVRSNMILIDQTPYIFNATLKENITLGQNYSEEKIYSILRAVSLEKLLTNLPNGINTILERGGGTLSGGEKQRISIARGLITGKTIMLMDESTSALDEQTAISIENMVVNLPNIMLIMVTHNLRKSIAQQLNSVVSIND